MRAERVKLKSGKDDKIFRPFPAHPNRKPAQNRSGPTQPEWLNNSGRPPVLGCSPPSWCSPRDASKPKRARIPFAETRRRVKGALDEEQILIRDVELFG